MSFFFSIILVTQKNFTTIEVVWKIEKEGTSTFSQKQITKYMDNNRSSIGIQNRLAWIIRVLRYNQGSFPTSYTINLTKLKEIPSLWVVGKTRSGLVVLSSKSLQAKLPALSLLNKAWLATSKAFLREAMWGWGSSVISDASHGLVSLTVFTSLTNKCHLRSWWWSMHFLIH